MNRARDFSGDDRLRSLGSLANTLHGFFYTRKRFLNAEVIGRNLDDMETLLDILQTMTET